MATTARPNGGEPGTAERVASALLDADRMLGVGLSLREVIATLGISRATYYRWRRRFEGLTRGGVARVRDLERENARLRRIVADNALEIEMLRELSRGTY
jgi:putative transposase